MHPHCSTNPFMWQWILRHSGRFPVLTWILHYITQCPLLAKSPPKPFYPAPLVPGLKPGVSDIQPLCGCKHTITTLMAWIEESHIIPALSDIDFLQCISERRDYIIFQYPGFHPRLKYSALFRAEYSKFFHFTCKNSQSYW